LVGVGWVGNAGGTFARKEGGGSNQESTKVYTIELSEMRHCT
jgi:hypothetical protein